MAKLNDPREAAALIDDTLQKCWLSSRPVYITLPTDMVQKKIEGDRLKTPIDLSFPTNDLAREDYVVDVVLKYLQAAKDPIILVDACAIRHRVLKEVHDLIEKTMLPVFVTPSKSQLSYFLVCRNFTSATFDFPTWAKLVSQLQRFGFRSKYLLTLCSGQRCCE